jgi:hypothetical protein
MTDFSDIASFVRILDGRDLEMSRRVTQLVRRATSKCRQTLALAEAVDDFQGAFESLVQQLADGNGSRRVEVLAKLETIKLLCEPARRT